VHEHASVFSFPNSTLATLDAAAAKCNYTEYAATHATYPPKGPLPLPNGSARTAKGCDVYDQIFDAALEINPAFNLYRIYDMVRFPLHSP
jgi:carboxypeptidase D